MADTHSIFSKRHYEAVAKVIHDLDVGWDQERWVAQDFSQAFAKDNPQFDPEKFYNACGIAEISHDLPRPDPT